MPLDNTRKHLYIRYYDANLGRWLRKDPIEETGGYNLYNFASNNPTDKIDFYGLGIKIIPHKKDEMTSHYQETMKSLKKSPRKDSITNLENFMSFEVSYSAPPDCICRNGNAGDIVLSQEVFRGSVFHDDNFTPASTEKCSTGTYSKSATYLSKEKGCPGKSPGSYLDAPGGRVKPTFKFRARAWCRCKCEDDKLLDEKEFDWNSHVGLIASN